MLKVAPFSDGDCRVELVAEHVPVKRLVYRGTAPGPGGGGMPRSQKETRRWVWRGGRGYGALRRSDHVVVGYRDRRMALARWEGKEVAFGGWKQMASWE